jgi:hypothetical protein
VIGEKSFGGWPTLADFLGRRLNPAMRTCQTLNTRMQDLNRKLTRAANLLRTRIDVEIEQQNRDLLAAMSERARMPSLAADGRRTFGCSHQLLCREPAALCVRVRRTLHAGQPHRRDRHQHPFVVIALTAMLWRVKRSHGSA